MIIDDLKEERARLVRAVGQITKDFIFARDVFRLEQRIQCRVVTKVQVSPPTMTYRKYRPLIDPWWLWLRREWKNPYNRFGLYVFVAWWVIFGLSLLP